MSRLLIRNARVMPGDGTAVLPCADVVVEGERIVSISEGTEARRHEGTKTPEANGDRKGMESDSVIDAAGRVLMPGFVDAHTHALWAGDRLAEWEMRRGGASYLEVLEAGGGILSTVRAVRAAGPAELEDNLLARFEIMLREGTTTVEVKSGYGLTTTDELKMLRAIQSATKGGGAAAISVVPTALLGHAIDPEQPRFIDTVIHEMLPAVSQEFPGIAIDAYCEQGAWSVQDCRRLFERAIALGHPVRLHADQFNSLGGVDLGIELGALSVDHLEATDLEVLKRLARSKTYGVMLPACGFHVDGRYANGRAFLDAGGKLVLASNCNPGSAPTSSMPFVIALAVRKLGLTVAEAIEAVTSAPTDLLSLPDRGRIAPGMRADLILLRHMDERQLAYEVGGNPVDLVVCGGKTIG